VEARTAQIPERDWADLNCGDRLIDLPSALSLICHLPRRQCFLRLPGMTHVVTVSI